MDIISLDKTIPAVFEDAGTDSEVWLQDVDFLKGKKYLIEAASGTGKTSLCSFIYGERRDYRGEIRFDGKNLKEFREKELSAARTSSLSIVFQDLKLFPELTAMENVRIKNQLTAYKTDRQIRDLFARLGLDNRISYRADKLSLGQQQRVSFIRALCQPFDFIILDEPVSHLDQKNAGIMSAILKEELDSRGAGAIVTSLGVTLELDYDKSMKL